MATNVELSQKESDIRMMIAAEVHLGTKNCNYQMERYTFKRRNDGNFLTTFPHFLISYTMCYVQIIVCSERFYDYNVNSD
ncbi:unnamed protein product [Thlaspi arvense]|uniref:Ribosomal protein S2 n=1 Tax=Thlaspi arvense TaxID=13288 RepID=A0AAU9SA79_THLAR|nr:unnamed protein product [Thlaspi arvense]